eukprot:SAG31_NODE_1287_length_8999_cov_3.844382_1_plen_158_part_00
MIHNNSTFWCWRFDAKFSQQPSCHRMLQYTDRMCAASTVKSNINGMTTPWLSVARLSFPGVVASPHVNLRHKTRAQIYYRSNTITKVESQCYQSSVMANAITPAPPPALPPHLAIFALLMAGRRGRRTSREPLRTLAHAFARSYRQCKNRLAENFQC